MESGNSQRHGRFSQFQSSQRRSGYEPSDTETDWHDSPARDHEQKNGEFGPDQTPQFKLTLTRNVSPLKHNRRRASLFDVSSPKKEFSILSPPRRYTSKSPYKQRREDGYMFSGFSTSTCTHVSPFTKSDFERQNSLRKNQRTPNREERSMSERSSLSTRRANSAPRQRTRQKDLDDDENDKSNRKEASHHATPSVGELNEMLAKMKMQDGPVYDELPTLESMESLTNWDIFFSRDHTALALKKKNGLVKNVEGPHIDFVLQPQDNKNYINSDEDDCKAPSNFESSASRKSPVPSSAVSRKRSFKHSTEMSKKSDSSSKTSVSLQKFTANVRKRQSDGWFACMKRGPCKTSKSNCKTSNSPEGRYVDEATLIQKAYVVERLRQFWADKYQPRSFAEFACHAPEIQLLRKLTSSHDGIPQILLKGPSGSGKRSLVMALLTEIFGDTVWNMSHDLRFFHVQKKRPSQVAVPVTSSLHHFELNMASNPNARYALLGVTREISNTYAITPEVSTVNYKPDYKVIVVYGVDKAEESIQHLIKWIMDGYTDSCKLVLCCEDDENIIESVKNRCKVIQVDALTNPEIGEVLCHIANEENFDLPMSFASKIAGKSKQNLRRAIMALEACKANRYPFDDDQPITYGWEEDLIELAIKILAHPFPKRLLYMRGKFQKLLIEFIHPKLILLKLVEELLKGVEARSKRELYYWHAYYEKRLPVGTSALLKLEEFVAKFMSIHMRNLSNRQND